MARPINPLRTETVIVLVCIALLVPRLRTDARSEGLSEGTGVHAEAALRYARLRLWSDFLQERREQLPQHRLPSPSLSEYRAYLGAHGLRRRGDIATLYVLPPLDPLGKIDQIRVRLESRHEPLTLEIAMPGSHDEPQAVGRLEVLTDPDGVLKCRIDKGHNLALWSFWPIRPEPLLP